MQQPCMRCVRHLSRQYHNKLKLYDLCLLSDGYSLSSVEPVKHYMDATGTEK